VLRALVILCFAAACRPAAQVPSFTIRIAVFGRLDAVRPDRELKSWAGWIAGLVFEPLARVSPQGELVPVLASRVETIRPGELRIWLREGGRFSDGSALTADDVSNSLAGSALAAQREGDSIRVSARTSEIPIEILLEQTSIFRRSGQGWLGTGAFTIAEQDASHIVLERIARAPGLIDGVRMDAYATPQDAFARTLKGDADLLPEVQERWVEFFEGVPRLKILRAPGPTANVVTFNVKRLSRDERLALVSALSSDEIRRVAFGDHCVAPSSRPAVEPVGQGRKLDLIAVPILDRLGAAVRRELGPRGGALRTLEVPEFLSALQNGDFDLATIRPKVSPPMLIALTWRTGTPTNVLGYSNLAVDAALDAHDWEGARKALAADPPGAVICNPPSVIVIDSRIHTPPFGASRFIEGLPQWTVAQ
jgi:ABC-type transport system substrate-binding protein